MGFDSGGCRPRARRYVSIMEMLLPDVFGIQLLGRRLMAVSPALDARGTFTRQELREGSAQHQREGRQAGNGCDEGDRAKCG